MAAAAVGPGTVFQLENWGSYMMFGIEDMYRSQQLCDLTLRFPSRDLKAHSVVLYSCSPFFTALLKDKTAGHKIVKMPPQISADAMDAVLTFIYTGRLQCSLDVRLLLATARLVKLHVLARLLEAQLPPDPRHPHQQQQPQYRTPLPAAAAGTATPIKLESASRNGTRMGSSVERRQHHTKQRKILKPKFVDPPADVRPSRFEFPLGYAPPLQLPPLPSSLDSLDSLADSPPARPLHEPPYVPAPPAAAAAAEGSFIDAPISVTAPIDCDVSSSVNMAAGGATVDSSIATHRTLVQQQHTPPPPPSSTAASAVSAAAVRSNHVAMSSAATACKSIAPSALVISPAAVSGCVTAKMEVLSSGDAAGAAVSCLANTAADSRPLQMLQCSVCVAAGIECWFEAGAIPCHLERQHATLVAPPECLQCRTAPSPSPHPPSCRSSDNTSATDDQSDVGASLSHKPTTTTSTTTGSLRFTSVLDYISHVEEVHVPPASRATSTLSSLPAAGGAGANTGSSCPNTCSVCGYSAESWLTLCYHRYTRHRHAPPAYVHFPRCDRCDFEAMTPAQLAAHQQRRHHRLLRRYRCRHCPPHAPLFDSLSQLEGHRRTCHGAGAAGRRHNVWPCHQCGLAFSRSYNLKAHVRSMHRDSVGCGGGSGGDGGCFNSVPMAASVAPVASSLSLLSTAAELAGVVGSGEDTIYRTVGQDTSAVLTVPQSVATTVSLTTAHHDQLHELATLRYTGDALFCTTQQQQQSPLAAVSSGHSYTNARAHTVSLLTPVSTGELTQHVPEHQHHQQQQQLQQEQPLTCEFILATDVMSGPGGGASDVGRSSVIPIQDENGVVSYITLQPAAVSSHDTAALSADTIAASSLLDITHMPAAHSHMPHTAHMTDMLHATAHHHNSHELIHFDHQHQQQQQHQHQQQQQQLACESGTLLLPDHTAVVMATVKPSSSSSVALTATSDSAVVTVTGASDDGATVCKLEPLTQAPFARPTDLHSTMASSADATPLPVSVDHKSGVSVSGSSPLCQQQLVAVSQRRYGGALPAASTIKQTISARHLAAATGHRYLSDTGQQQEAAAAVERADTGDDWAQMMPTVLMVANDAPH